MKKLLFILGLTACLISAKAETFSTNNLALSTNHTILAFPITVESVTLFSTSTVPTIVKLIDGWVVSTNTAFTNYITYPTSIVSTVITSTGVTNTYTNTEIVNVAVPTAATTNGSPYVLKTLVVPASGELLTVTGPLTFARRLTVGTSVAGISFVMEYRTP